MAAKKTPADIIAADIIARVQKTIGRHMWERLSPEGRLVEVRSVFCCDMLTSFGPPDHALCVEVHRVFSQTNRAQEFRDFNIACLRSDIVRHAVVLARLIEDSKHTLNRRPHEGWSEYERRCLSRRVSLECEAANERRTMEYKRGLLTDVYGVEVSA